MIPRLLEYEDGRVKVTAEAYGIPEIKNLIDKYDMDVEPYLEYVNGMSSPDSPYINIPEEEKKESAIYDIQNTFGEFDWEDELVTKAIKRLSELHTSTLRRYYDSLKISIDKMSQYLRDKPITEGKDGNLSEIIRIHKEGGTTIRNFKDIERQVDEELKMKMKGSNEMGEY